MDKRQVSIESTRTEILGVPVNAVSMKSVLEHIHTMLEDSATQVIAAVNPEKVIAAQRNPDLLRALENAALVIPDGIGVVFATRLLGKDRMERVPGADLMPEICRLASINGKSVFLFGAKEEIVHRAAAQLKTRYHGLIVAGTHHGYVAEEDMEQLVDTVNSSGADILFVGLGSPRQELWMERYRERLSVRLCQGVGGTFDAICGYPKRAPIALQKLHLEWLYRLVTQPQRAHRQLALPRFAAQVVRQLVFPGRRV